MYCTLIPGVAVVGGDPLQRDPELVLADVNRALVSEQGAKRYGVVIADGVVDAPATELLRKEMESSRGETGVFNTGGDIEDIKARCLEETHMPAPVAPSF